MSKRSFVEFPFRLKPQQEEQREHHFKILNPIMFRTRAFLGIPIPEPTNKNAEPERPIREPRAKRKAQPFVDKVRLREPVKVFTDDYLSEWESFNSRIKETYEQIQQGVLPLEPALTCEESIDEMEIEQQVVEPTHDDTHPQLTIGDLPETDIGQVRINEQEEEPAVVKEEPKDSQESPCRASWGVLVDEPAGLLYSLQPVEKFGRTQVRKRAKANTMQPSTLPPLLDVSLHTHRSSDAEQPLLQV